MSDQNRFTFVNDPTPEIGLDKDRPTKDDDQNESSTGKKTSSSAHNPLVAFIGMVILSVLLVALGLLWQDDTSLIAWTDAFWLAFALEFFAGWVLFVYNRNIFSPLFYGAKTFVLMFVGKRPKTDYYTYMKGIYDNPIDAYYYIVLFLSAFVLLIPSVILLVIVL